MHFIFGLIGNERGRGVSEPHTSYKESRSSLLSSSSLAPRNCR